MAISRGPTKGERLGVEVSRVREYFWFLAGAVLVCGTLYFFYIFPEKGAGIEQPVYFSHRVHAGVKEISCLFCHPFAERSPRAGIPDVEKCFFCHKHIIPLHPEIQKELWYLDNGVPVPWARAYYIPDHVHFNHEPHVRRGIDCRVCHGDVAKWDRLPRVDFKMGFCVGCHRALGAELDCWLACHR